MTEKKQSKKRPKVNSEMQHASRGTYSESEIERGLVALSLVSDNSRRASRLLAEQGLVINESTLRGWRKRHADRYRQLQQDLLPELREQLAEAHTDIANREIELANKLAARLEETYGQLEPRDLSTAMRNADVGSGIHTQRASELRGEPNVRVRHERDGAEILRQLQATGVRFMPYIEEALNSSAEEITDKDEDTSST